MVLSTEKEQVFPNLSAAGYRVTSQETESYNCAAWAANDDSKPWWPTRISGYYWPDGLPKEATIDNFIAAYKTLGFDVCDGESLEEGYEKIAIYATADGEPTHVARQCENGKWTSKLGDWEDIEHNVLAAFDNSDYGSAVKTMKRPR